MKSSDIQRRWDPLVGQKNMEVRNAPPFRFEDRSADERGGGFESDPGEDHLLPRVPSGQLDRVEGGVDDSYASPLGLGLGLFGEPLHQADVLERFQRIHSRGWMTWHVLAA